jgi:hypothetical protein
MKALKTCLLFVLSITLFSACNNAEEGEGVLNIFGGEKILPPSNGGILDILVIANDNVWDGPAGDAFQKHFTAMSYGLPQPEPLYTVRQVGGRDFGSLLKRSRYLVLISIGDSALFRTENNKWARDQFVVFLQAPNQSLLRKLILANNKEIDALIEQREMQRMSKRIAPLTHKTYPAFFAENHIKIAIPKDFEISVEKENLVVYWRRTKISDMGIIIHRGPLPQDAAIIGGHVVPLRDSITKLYVPGARENSYMITEDIIKPSITPTEIAGNFALETRGLWRTEGDIMGGPFVSYSIYDEENQQLIYIDAFLLQPDKKKRKTLFELESVLSTFQLTP